MISSLGTGLLLGLALITPLGPQNLFVITQWLSGGLRRGLWAAVVAGTCDTLLILLGASGVAVVLLGVPGARSVLLLGGAVFLVVIGCQALAQRPARDPEPTTRDTGSSGRNARPTGRNTGHPGPDTRPAGPDEGLTGPSEGTAPVPHTTRALAARGTAEADSHDAVGVTARSGLALQDAGATRPVPWRRVVTRTMAVSLLNPHAIMDTVVVLGAAVAAHGSSERPALVIGMALASWLWFTVLACSGAALAGRFTARARQWLDRISGALLLGFALLVLAEFVRTI